jgi:hypothetical protein
MIHRMLDILTDWPQDVAGMSINDRQTNSIARLEPLIFYALILLFLAPVWAVKYFSSQDGVGHIENATILRHMFGPAKEFYRHYYRINPFPEPNYSGHVLLMFLTTIFAPATALKIIASLFIVSFPIAVRYSCESIRKDGAGTALLSLPFIYGMTLLKGNFNFCFGLVLFFVVIGFWIRQREGMRFLATLVLMLLVLLMYFSHVVPLIMAMLAIGGIEIAFCQREKKVDVARLGRLAIAFAPGIILSAAFFLSRGKGEVDRLSPGVLFLQFVRLQALVSYTKIEAWLAIAVALLFLIATICTIRRISQNAQIIWDIFAVLAIVSTAIYFIVPNSASGGGQISFRLSLFPYFFLILWLAARPMPRKISIFVATMISIISIATIIVQYTTAARVSDYVAEFTSISPHVKRGSTLLPVIASWDDYLPNGKSFTHKVRPMLLAAGYVAAERGVIDLGNYEASQGYFPLLWKNGVDLKNADYIVVWQTGKTDRDSLLTAMQPLLDAQYHRVYTSPHGWAKLYRRDVGQ